MNEHDNHRNDNHSIIPVHLGIDAIRNNGYNDTAYALFELIDNSVEAGAEHINMAAFAGQSDIQQIAVIDDGKGMDSNALRQGLQYGNGANIGRLPSKLKGLGRFGVGLPASTFSQCERMDVYSWKEGATNALWTYVDLEEVRTMKMRDVPLPEPAALPDDILRIFPGVKEDFHHGTLVVWSKVDRATWKRPSTIVEKTARLAGRVYRQFLSTEQLDMQFLAVKKNGDIDFRKKVEAVDPLFLSPNPDPRSAPFNLEPMFTPFLNMRNEDGSIAPKIIPFPDTGEVIGEVKIYAAHRRIGDVVNAAKIDGHDDPGDAKFGKVAKELEGVSIVRAGRELMLDARWLSEAATVDRWIGVTVEFQPVLDEHFGVTNSKQGVGRLSAYVRREAAFSSEISDDNPLAVRVAREIHDLLAKMRRLVQEERSKSRTGGRGKTTSDDAMLKQASEKIKQRAEQGHATENDRKNPEEHLPEIKEGYPDDAKDRAQFVVRGGLRVDIIGGDVDATHIFKTEDRGGVTLITLNRQHPMFDALQKALIQEPDEAEPIEMRLKRVEHVLKRLIIAYARAESETTASPKDKREFERVRHRWSTVAIDIFDHNGDDG